MKKGVAFLICLLGVRLGAKRIGTKGFAFWERINRLRAWAATLLNFVQLASGAGLLWGLRPLRCEGLSWYRHGALTLPAKVQGAHFSTNQL